MRWRRPVRARCQRSPRPLPRRVSAKLYARADAPPADSPRSTARWTCPSLRSSEGQGQQGGCQNVQYGKRESSCLGPTTSRAESTGENYTPGKGTATGVMTSVLTRTRRHFLRDRRRVGSFDSKRAERPKVLCSG